ncbi:MAG: hypothetical protein LBU45_05960 [Azoarcus sp.]|nr:hypothetical protein [Azoarcus sp.]
MSVDSATMGAFAPSAQNDEFVANGFVEAAPHRHSARSLPLTIIPRAAFPSPSFRAQPSGVVAESCF